MWLEWEAWSQLRQRAASHPLKHSCDLSFLKHRGGRLALSQEVNLHIYSAGKVHSMFIL